MSGKLTKLPAFYCEDRLIAVAKDFGRRLKNAIYEYEIQEVRGRVIHPDERFPSARGNSNSVTSQCTVVESAEELQRYVNEFRSPFRDSLDALKRRLDEGCALFLARRTNKADGGDEVVGYSIAEIGGFSVVGIKRKIPKDILFVHYTEVANKHRGQRIAQVLTSARNEYCRRRGIKKSCTAHTTGNLPSERAFRKFGSRVLCYSVRISLFKGFIVWHTPWRKIERALAELDDDLAEVSDKL
jgi:GNAT superfamily N-acetyltransferase